MTPKNRGSTPMSTWGNTICVNIMVASATGSFTGEQGSDEVDVT